MILLFPYVLRLISSFTSILGFQTSHLYQVSRTTTLCLSLRIFNSPLTLRVFVILSSTKNNIFNNEHGRHHFLCSCTALISKEIKETVYFTFYKLLMFIRFPYKFFFFHLQVEKLSCIHFKT